MNEWVSLNSISAGGVRVLAQSEPATVNYLMIGLLIFVALLLLTFVVARMRAKTKEKEKAKSARPKELEAPRPTLDPLGNRPEVDAPVEIHDGMSLAEIKLAKRSRVVGEKGRRETASQATERAKRDHEKPVVETPVAEEPVEPSVLVEEVVVEEPVVDFPVVEKEVVEDEVVEFPVVEQAPVDEVVAEENITEEPAAETPVAETPAVEQTPEEEPKVAAKPAFTLPKPLPRPTKKADDDTTESDGKLPKLTLPRPKDLTLPVPEPKVEPVAEVAPEPEIAPEPVVETAPEPEVAPEPVVETTPEPEAVPEPVAEVAPEPKAVAKVEKPKAAEKAEKVEKPKSLRDGLQKTRTGFADRLGNLFKREKLDADLIDEIEEILFTADIGSNVANNILKAVEDHLDSNDKQDPAAVWGFIRDYCEGILKEHESAIEYESASPFVILVIGVNGVGKTTTIGKLAAKLTREGKKVLVVAGDTFRAAAVDQLAIWADRTGISLHKGEDQADPASVIFSGIERGVKEGADVIICDTAGRLHTKVNLLDELEKMGRVATKAMPGAPHETILVLDANTGQNAIAQAKLFREALEITGIVLTKLDGTAKGGVILGLCDELKAPVRYIGIGEGIDDLRAFHADEFVEALFM